MKKIRGAVFILALALGLCLAQTVGAERLEDRVGLLRAMGFIDVFEADSDMDAPVTRGEFAAVIQNFTTGDSAAYAEYYSDVPRSHAYASEICAVTRAGFMIGDEKGRFYPEEPITGNEALTVCVKILGYQLLSEKSGGYATGYIQAAAQSGLSDFIAYGSEDLTRKQVCELIFELLDCKVMEVSEFSSEKMTYTVSSETLAEAMFNLYDGRGRVTATPVTGLYSTDAVGAGMIQIEGVTYETELEVIDTIGRYMRYYYTDDGGDKTLVYMYEDESRDETLLLKSSEIDEFKNYVYTYKNGKKTASLSLDVTVIYNGVRTSYEELAQNELSPDDGEVLLISSNGSGKLYDIAVITSYEYYTVKQVGTAQGVIYDKYGKAPLDMDPEGEDRYLAHTAYGKEVALSYYKENDILRVFRSKDGKILYVSMVTEKITAAPQSCSPDSDTITINGVKYDCIRGLIPAVTDENGVVLRKAVSIGESGSFYLNENGMIVAYVPQLAIEETVGFVMQAQYVPDEFDYEACVIKILSAEEPQIYITAEKVYYTSPYDSTRKKLTAKALYDALPKDGDMRVARDVYLFKINEEGYLTELIAAKDMTGVANYQGYTVGRFTKDFERTGVRVYLQRIGTRYIPDANTKVFKVPYDASASNDAYTCGTMSSIFGSDSRSNHLVVYGSDIDTAPKAVVVWTDDTGAGSSNIDGIIRTNPMVITDVEQSVRDDGDIGYVIKGYQGGVLVEKEASDKIQSYSVTKWGYSGVKIENLCRGDIIMYDIDSKGRINYFLPLLLTSNKQAATREVLNSGTIYDYDAIAILHTLYGTVIRSTANTITVNARADQNPSYNRTYSAGSANVILVNNGTVEKITLNDVEEGDEIFLRDYNHNLMDVVIYRK